MIKMKCKLSKEFFKLNSISKDSWINEIKDIFNKKGYLEIVLINNINNFNYSKTIYQETETKTKYLLDKGWVDII